MQPPPRTGRPGASGPPPSGPNMFRRTRPYKHAAAAPATMPPVAQPMTDPFAFSRAPPPMAAGGLPTVSNSNPAPVQTPSNAMYPQPGSGLPPQPQTLEGATAAASGVTLFNPHSTPPLGPTGYVSSHNEQGYFNSREQIPSASTESAPMATASEPSQTPLNPEFQGQSGPLPVPFQPLPPVTTSSSQWAPDHGSRPPSVQNYFQPTSDPVPQPFYMPPQTQMYPSHSPSPLHNTPTPPTQPAHLQNQASLPSQNPLKPPTSQWPDPNGPQQHNSHFQTQSYFSQSSAAPDLWFNPPPQDSGYHQMGTGMGHPQPLLDAAGSQPATSTGPGPSSSTVPAPLPHYQESGTLSMFFKDNDVENEETLSAERNKAVNGIAGTFQLHNNQQAHSSHADVSSDYQGAFLQDHSQVPYMIDGNQPSQGNAQKPSDSQFDHVENLECVPNQEVLPSEIHSNTAATAPHSAEQFETGPNLETPDSIPRPMRSASVSSNYSNMSHGSGTGTRRHQGVVGTFIQQESSRLSDDPNQPVAAAAAGGYFEQIDTSPAGDVGVQQSSLEQMWPPTPSPPKPTGIFQASANSSFEPVRSHGVGVRPAEVDRAKMVAEGGADCTPGNMEQPPDNMENVYGSGHPLPAGAGGAVPPLTHPVVYSHSRPSSRAHGVNQPCESPATTLWAQNDPTTLGGNILLAPAAPIVLAPLREPSADVIQPPEDGPLDLQPSQRTQPPSHQHSENLENPPKVSEAEPSDSQGNLGYASLLVSGSLHQPVFIAPPVSNYSVIPPSTTPQAATQSSLRETTPPVRLIAQGQGPTTSQPASVTCNQNPLFSPGILSFSVSASNQSPLNLTRDNTAATTSEITASPHPQPVRPPLSRGQSVAGESNSALQVNLQTSLVNDPSSNHNQPSNYELLDFSMHQSQAQSQASGHPSSLHESPQSSNGFYLQVTKDALKVEGNASVQTPTSSSTTQVPPAPSQTAPNTQQPPAEPPKVLDSQAAQHGQKDAPPVTASGAQPPSYQYPAPIQGPSAGNAPPPGPQGPPGAPQTTPAEPPRPPSSAGSHQGYGPPPAPGQMYSGYYNNYGDYPDSRAPYPSGQYPPPSGDPRAQPYYQVSIRLSNKRQCKKCYCSCVSHGKRKSKFNLQHFTRRKAGYEDQWQYYPGYDASFDEDYRRQGDAYGDDFDRRSVHSEQSVHSSHSHHSRRSSFSSRSQQSQVYRSQPDLVSAAYDNTSSTLAVDYSYGQYPDQTDASHNYSQYYPSGYTTETPPRPATPEKFTIPHRCARFGPGGHLVQVLPNLPSAGQPALVDIHNLETMLQDTTDQAELRGFPGPLVKEETHKVDVIKFSQNKALECSRDNNLLDRDSARLLWDFIMLLCRQNGTVVGTDIADLLLKEHRSVWLPGKSPNEANLIDFNNEPLARAEEEPGAGPLSLLSDTFMTVPENFGKETERFRELLLFGRKKDALEAAMKGGLWGHALLLASKMDNRTHARVMTRFANSLPINDPLQTVYQLMSGRMPASATCCGEEKWGDWRPHLAMVLSNLTHTLDLDTRTITTMGDTLASKGLVDAAHFCYLMAQVGLGVFTKKSTKMVLIGSNHSLPFSQFATNEAIQRTEAYEYAQSLGSQPCSLPNFQVFKLIYACRLAEAGLSAQAFHYCEVISKTVLVQPSYYSPVFISQIIQMSEKLRFFDPQLKEKPEQELFVEPEWLIRLRQLDGQMKTGLITYNADRTTPIQFECSSPSSDLDHPSPPNSMSLDNPAPDNPLMSSLLPGSPPQGVQLMPPGLFVFRGPLVLYLEVYAFHLYLCFLVFSVIQSSGRRSRTTSESSTHSGGRERSNSTVVQASPPPPSIPEQPIKEEAKKVKKDSPKKKGVGWLGWIIGKGKNEAHLPDDKNKSIVWDEKKQRWVDLNEPEEESKPPPPPPSVFPKMPQVPGPGGPAAPPSSIPPVNMFSRKSRYVDVLNPSRAAKPGGPAPAPADIFAPLAPMPIPTNLFVPSSGVCHVQDGIITCIHQQHLMFTPMLLPPAPEGPTVPDGSHSGEVSLSLLS
uniref:Protein transport protein sec16 n=1 Tax=Astatotilapia calliptera TaxID=8154 RepID=A0A3P8RK48_ASTCA